MRKSNRENVERKLNMKIVKRIIKVLMCAFFIAQVMFCVKPVKAISAGDTAYAERAEKGFYTIQSWNGSEWIYVTYSITNYVDEYGKKRVAYCVNPDRKGIGYISGEYSGYDVEVKNIIKDDRAWRVLTNGYPYKTPDELGVENDQDAYLTTKMALYAMLRNNNSDDIKRMYRAGEDRVAGQDLDEIKRRGSKVIEAICKLVDVGNNGSSKMQFENCVSISKVGEFKVFAQDEKYCYQRMKVSSSVECTQYDIKGIKGFPREAKIADINGIEKTTFKGGDEFIIMVPKSNIIEDIAGLVEITATVRNYPIYYAECKEENLQNYYLCCDEYSKINSVEGKVNVQIKKSDLHIQKIDKDDKLPIQGVEFSIKYKNGAEIGTFTTDENGDIFIRNIHQGEIVVKEIGCDEKYQIDSNEKIINIGYGENVSIVIENEKKKDTETVKKQDVLDVGEKLPRTGEISIELIALVFPILFSLGVKRFI